jgi:(p)ppGpp synthase/HD superfamily hydrolase
MNIVERAKKFATEAHCAIGQTRKYTGEPYIKHPEAVVALLREHGIAEPTTLAAAWLHDVVEDTPITIEEIMQLFGPTITSIVMDLTDPSDLKGNRRTRKAAICERWKGASAAAQTVKCADMIDNTKSIVERDPNFAVTYMREKEALLPILTRADVSLWNRANALLVAYQRSVLDAHLEGRPHA